MTNQKQKLIDSINSINDNCENEYIVSELVKKRALNYIQHSQILFEHIVSTARNSIQFETTHSDDTYYEVEVFEDKIAILMVPEHDYVHAIEDILYF